MAKSKNIESCVKLLMAEYFREFQIDEMFRCFVGEKKETFNLIKYSCIHSQVFDQRFKSMFHAEINTFIVFAEAKTVEKRFHIFFSVSLSDTQNQIYFRSLTTFRSKFVLFYQTEDLFHSFTMD